MLLAIITLKEYALRNGIDPVVARHKAQRGTFHTAKKLGRDWFIDEHEPYADGRVKSGRYIGWRKRFADPTDLRVEVDKEGTVVNGNQRLEVAKRLGITEVPVKPHDSSDN